MEQRKIPPYGKSLRDLQRQGLRPANDIYVFTGLRAWQKSHCFALMYPERLLCLPPWQDPTTFLFPVKGCSILIHDTLASDMDYIDSLASAVFTEGATAVRFISQDFKLIIYNKDMS